MLNVDNGKFWNHSLLCVQHMIEGILTVKNGALIDINWGFVIVSKPTEITDSIVKGNGWVLELHKGLEIRQLGNKYELNIETKLNGAKNN